MRSHETAGRLRNPLLTFHIAATAGVFGADLVLVALGAAGLGGADPVTVYPAARLVGEALALPLAIASLASGVALALTSSWGLFKFWWVTIKLAITGLLTAVLLFVLVPGLESAAAAAIGQPGRSIAGVPLLIGPAAASALLLIALALSVFKPRWRLRAPPPAVVGLGVIVAGLLSPGDAAAQPLGDRGEILFRQRCASCHAVKPGVRSMAPHLAGVIGRQAGKAPLANYSPAMRSSGLTWTGDRLDAFLANPHEVVSGTRMTFRVANPEERAAIISFLRKSKGTE